MKQVFIFLVAFSKIITVNAQYIESFNIANKGILSGDCTTNDPISCNSIDFSGVDWTIGGDLSGIDIEGFFTVGGHLLSEDLDEPACWISPTLDISGAGAVSLTVTITIPSGAKWEESPNAGSIDYADVEYSVDLGTFVPIANVSDCPSSGHTISASNCGIDAELIGPLTYTPSASGITGNTLQIRVCFDTNSGDDDGWLEEVSVPEANVSILPVEFISFTAQYQQKDILLSWLTASEENNDFFEIQHSTDGRAFSPIGKIDGKGTTSEVQRYDFTHLTPGRGQHFYRLKQVDYDGTFAYSTIESVFFDQISSNTATISPNPFQNQLQLQWNLNSNSTTPGNNITVDIFDVYGKRWHSIPLEANALKATIDLSGLVSGTYFLHIREQGTDFKPLRIIKI